MGGIVAVFVVLLGLLWTRLRTTPELDWDTIVLPLAQKYAGKTSSSTPLQGKTIVITGATNGLGLALTRVLSRLGGNVVALGRSSTRLEQLRQEIPSVRTFEMDLADLEAVSHVADEMAVALKESGIDILINNAGFSPGLDFLGSREGQFDRAFVVNYLSHVLLTEKLAPLLVQSPRPILAQMSSSFHWAVDGSDLSVPSMTSDGDTSVSTGMPIAARPGGNRDFYLLRGARSYANSKLAQIYHSRSLKNMPEFANVRVVSVDPGIVATNICSTSSVAAFLYKAFAFPMEGWGIASMLYALFDADSVKKEDDAANKNDYYINADYFRLYEYIIPRETPSWMYSILPWRDILVIAVGSLGLFLQASTAHAGPRPSSPESYNQTRGDELHRWSKNAISKYLS